MGAGPDRSAVEKLKQLVDVLNRSAPVRQLRRLGALSLVRGASRDVDVDTDGAVVFPILLIVFSCTVTFPRTGDV